MRRDPAPPKAFACCCGQMHRFGPLEEVAIKEYLARLGETVLVTTPYGAWRVPRVYIAAHGLLAENVPALAVVHGWAREEGVDV
jgi:hypothetical protein